MEDATYPTDVRFLHVLQGTDANVYTPDAAVLIQSTSGTPFDGALLPGAVVFFKRDMNTAFTVLNYQVPPTLPRITSQD